MICLRSNLQSNARQPLLPKNVRIFLVADKSAASFRQTSSEPKKNPRDFGMEAQEADTGVISSSKRVRRPNPRYTSSFDENKENRNAVCGKIGENSQPGQGTCWTTGSRPARRVMRHGTGPRQLQSKRSHLQSRLRNSQGLIKVKKDSPQSSRIFP